MFALLSYLYSDWINSMAQIEADYQLCVRKEHPNKDGQHQTRKDTELLYIESKIM